MRKCDKLTEEQRCLMLADYLDGVMRTADIGNKYGVSRSWASELARRTGLAMRRPVQRRKSKLTEEQRCLMLADYADGILLLREISEKYGVGASYPSELARRTGLTPRCPHMVGRQKRVIERGSMMSTDRVFSHPNFGKEARVEVNGREVRLVFVAGTPALAHDLAKEIVCMLKAGSLSLTMMGEPTDG